MTECDFPFEELSKATMNDKKSDGNGIDFIVATDIGKCKIQKMSSDELILLIKDGLGK